MDLERLALSFAARKHKGQTRSWTGLPYILHPMEVADYLRLVSDNEHLIAAGYLHDTLEDTDTDTEELEEIFGPLTTQIVIEVTNVAVPQDGNRKARVQKNIEHVAKAGPFGQTLKLADICSNLRGLASINPRFAERYIAEKLMQMTFLPLGDERLRTMALLIADSESQILSGKWRPTEGRSWTDHLVPEGD